MKKIIVCLLSFFIMISLSGCEKIEKINWQDNYQMTYFYVEDCGNCQYFKENVLPAIQEEFGDHMTIVCYDMDTTDNFEDMKRVYDEHVEQIIDFDQDDYGYGPLVFLEGYIAILGAANEDNYVDHLINAIEKKKMDQPGENETYYYLKDGLVKE